MNIAGTALILLFHGQFRAPFFRGSDWKMRQNDVSLRICCRSRFGVRASVGPASPAVLLLEFAVNFIRPIVCVCARFPEQSALSVTTNCILSRTSFGSYS